MAAPPTETTRTHPPPPPESGQRSGNHRRKQGTDGGGRKYSSGLRSQVFVVVVRLSCGSFFGSLSGQCLITTKSKV